MAFILYDLQVHKVFCLCCEF